ncbi:MAG: hypothetical protein H0U67_16425 [Gemmatimonadetes bacterium]|jgi:hypothetical protein|nr:hypothetical protein [Gemmatimonadota bacterium]
MNLFDRRVGRLEGRIPPPPPQSPAQEWIHTLDVTELEILEEAMTTLGIETMHPDTDLAPLPADLRRRYEALRVDWAIFYGDLDHER